MTFIIILLLLIVSITSTTLLYYALKRINQYENLLFEFQQIISYSTEKMKDVDSLGHYEADDETGFFFNQLKQLQLLLNDVFETEEVEEINDKKETE